MLQVGTLDDVSLPRAPGVPLARLVNVIVEETDVAIVIRKTEW